MNKTTCCKVLALGAVTACTELSPDASPESPGSGGQALALASVSEDPAAQSADWPSAGHDWAHSGHNPGESAIGPDNVAALAVAWQHTFQLAGQSVPVIATAVTADGIAYMVDAAGFAHARQLDDGALLWTSPVSPATPDPVFGAVVQGSPVVSDDGLYVGDADATVFKVDRQTGGVVWSRQVETNPQALIQGDLATAGPFVVFGVSSFENLVGPGGDLTMRGSVVALDRDDGSMAWQLFTTSDQSLERPKFGAGVAVWSSPAIDFWRNRIYIGTGQFYEPGSERPSRGSARDVDLSDSLLGISLCDGRLARHRQFTSGDVWSSQYPDGRDFDVGAPPNLFDIPGRGGRIAAVGVGDKEGTYHVLNRRTFRPLWSRRVALGSVVGGFQATAAHADGVLYVAAHERIDGRALTESIPPGQSATFLGTPEGGMLIQKGSRTNILALDAATGEVRWSYTALGAITFAPLIVANGVVYHGDVNGALRGLDASSGALLWQAQLGGIPDGQGAFVAGNSITGLSLSRGRLLVSSLPAPIPGAPSGLTAFGVPE